MSANDQLESSAVLVLIALFVGIIGQGLFLAVSVGPAICTSRCILMHSVQSQLSTQVKKDTSVFGALLRLRTIMVVTSAGLPA